MQNLPTFAVGRSVTQGSFVMRNGKSKMRLLFSKFLSLQITYKHLHKD